MLGEEIEESKLVKKFLRVFLERNIYTLWHHLNNFLTSKTQALKILYLNEKKVIPNNYESNLGEDNIWYLDNGVNNHMIEDRRYFAKINKSITRKVKFGDDSRIDIKGK